MRAYLLSALLASALFHSQVGINTTDPKTTLDITAKDEAFPGMQAPRIIRAQLTSKGNYGSSQTGAIIYISDIAAGDTTGQRANITATGYYYFDGTAWQKMLSQQSNDWALAGNAASATDFLGTTNSQPLPLKVNNTNAGEITSEQTIIGRGTGGYTATGNTGLGILALKETTTRDDNVAIGYNALSTNTTGERNVALGNGAGVTDGTLVNTIAIGTDAKVSASNSMVLGNNVKVGIGTSAPSEKFHVAGKVRIADGTQGANKVLTSDANGVASWNNPAVNNIYTSDGSLSGNRTVTQNANTLAFTSTAVNGFSVDGTTLSVDAANNRIGVGTNAPTHTLDVNGRARIRNTDQLTSTTLSPVYVDENGLIGKASASSQSQVALYKSASALAFTPSDYNAGNEHIVPITAGHQSINTINTTVPATGNVRIGQAGNYLIGASLNFLLRSPVTDARIFMALILKSVLMQG